MKLVNPTTKSYQQLTSALTEHFWRCWRFFCQVLLVQPSMASYFEPIIRVFRPNYRAGLLAARWVQCQKIDDFLRLELRPARQWQGFIPGQHVDLTVDINGRAITRTFSIACSLQHYQQQGTIVLLMKIQADGTLTKALASSTLNSYPCYLSPAYGTFVLAPQRSSLLMAAGSGITPIYAMLSSISRLTHPITLIYLARSDNPLLQAELNALMVKFPLLSIHFIHTNQRARLAPTELAALVPGFMDHQIYLCGPASFSKQWQAWFLAQGIQQQRILQESFGKFVIPNEVASGLDTASSAETSSLVIEVLPSGKQLLSQGTLLQSLELAGLQPRYGCRRGICMQCLCYKTQGQIRNLVTGEISDNHSSVIQLCISQAVSAVQLELNKTVADV